MDTLQAIWAILQGAIIVLAIPFLFGCLVAAIAGNKGRNTLLWFLYGMAIFIVALPHVLLIKPNANALGWRKCPYCAETVKAEAKVCRHCQRSLPATGERQADITSTALG